MSQERLKTPAGYHLLVSRRAHNLDLLYRTEIRRGHRPRAFSLVDTRVAISEYDWSSLLNLSRQVVSRVGTLAGAICQKNLYAIGGTGWPLHYIGPDEYFRDSVEDWVNNLWAPMANIRGEPYDLGVSLFLDGCAIDHDGDNVMILRRDSQDMPRLQFVAAHRIGNRQTAAATADGYSVVLKGPFAGAKMCNGVIFNRDGEVIAYRVLGVTEAEDMDVPVEQAQMVYEPAWHDQGRGIPRVAPTLLDFIDVEDINYFLRRQVKQDAALGIAVHNESGEPPTGTSVVGGDETTPRAVNNANPDVEVEYLEGNELMYFRSNTGGKIHPIESARPHPNTEAFVTRLESVGLYAIGWHRGLLDPAGLRGANTRLVQDTARHSIKWRQRTLRKRKLRATAWAIAAGIQRGSIPETSDPWWRYLTWQMPEQLTVDTGNDASADLEALRYGSTTLAAVAGKAGGRADDIIRQRGREARQVLAEARRLVDEWGISFDLALSLIRQPNNGGGAPAPAAPAAGAGASGKPPEDDAEDPEEED